jgi:hypothetical protein
MPFPFAHPAAVLPLRRFCPRYLSLPGLIIGSLAPDVGYFSAHFRLGEFSHGLFPGSFAFCLPAGLLMFVIFHSTRAAVVAMLPVRYRPACLRLVQRPLGSPLLIVVSLLIGSWTHILLDSITHQDGWLVEHLPVLQRSLPWFGPSRFAVYDFLYAVCTFLGVTWLAAEYLRWLESEAAFPGRIGVGVKWGCAILLAGLILLIALVSRGAHRSIGIIPGGIIAVLIVTGFLVGTGRSFVSPK